MFRRTDLDDSAARIRIKPAKGGGTDLARPNLQQLTLDLSKTVAVLEVTHNLPAQRALIYDNHVIQALSTDRANQPLHVGVIARESAAP